MTKFPYEMSRGSTSLGLTFRRLEVSGELFQRYSSLEAPSSGPSYLVLSRRSSHRSLLKANPLPTSPPSEQREGERAAQRAQGPMGNAAIGPHTTRHLKKAAMLSLHVMLGLCYVGYTTRNPQYALEPRTTIKQQTAETTVRAGVRTGQRIHYLKWDACRTKQL